MIADLSDPSDIHHDPYESEMGPLHKKLGPLSRIETKSDIEDVIKNISELQKYAVWRNPLQNQDPHQMEEQREKNYNMKLEIQ